jgi:hypothetical protein
LGWKSWILKQILKRIGIKGLEWLFGPEIGKNMIDEEMEKDSDGDGLNDALDSDADWDRDGIPNPDDIDDDNDGVEDQLDWKNNNPKKKCQ